MTDRELDALVAQHLFGYEVPGTVLCWYDECGHWHSDCDPGLGDNEQQPVYLLARCLCNIRGPGDSIDLYGHHWACFEVVPHYSTNPVACALVLDELERREWWWEMKHLPGVDPDERYRVFVHGNQHHKQACSSNRYRAVCLTVLAACGVTVP